MLIICVWILAIQCGECPTEYNPCMSSCPNTCIYKSTDCTTTCVEGCDCPENQVMRNVLNDEIVGLDENFLLF